LESVFDGFTFKEIDKLSIDVSPLLHDSLVLLLDLLPQFSPLLLHFFPMLLLIFLLSDVLFTCLKFYLFDALNLLLMYVFICSTSFYFQAIHFLRVFGASKIPTFFVFQQILLAAISKIYHVLFAVSALPTSFI